ncbi:MAG: hypothetical protein AB8I08_29295 [Sandaracinaceae bacterium]
MSIEMSGDVRGWFHERLDAALLRHRVDAGEPTRLYLIELLAGMAVDASSASLGEPLAIQLAEAHQAEGVEKLRRLRSMGDSALYGLGFFEDHLERRGVNRDYVVAMGGRAYRSLESLAGFSRAEAVRQPVYAELAVGFGRYAAVFDDVRESTELRTPQDIVRLYERYRRTRSPHLAARLREEGVFMQVPGSDGTLH